MEGKACDLIFGSPEGESYPCTGLDRPLGIQDVEAPRILTHEGATAAFTPKRYGWY
jgi:hypothetical protein